MLAVGAAAGLAQETEHPSAPVVPAPVGDTGYQQIEQLSRVIELIRQTYVEEEKVTYDKLVHSALEGMLKDLDPHSQFLTPEIFARMQQEQSNTYEGVGITISTKADAITIVTVREDGPAARAGIMPGDVIIKIGDAMAEDVGINEAAQKLKGKPGEPLKITIQRSATKEVREVEMVRQVISTVTVKDAMVLDPALGGSFKVGYVRILQFTQPTAHELALALDKLEDESGLQALVVDLRNNPGGLITSAAEVAGEFLPPSTTVVTTEGRDGQTKGPPYKTPERKRRKRDYPLAVLVNHASASGAELVAGALQDLRRAVIVGETTFGKGSVQSVIPIEGGAAVRLTTAKYYTPAHHTIHEKGIKPNIVATHTPDEERNIMEFWRRGEAITSDAKTLAKLGDRQLERAANALKGVLVFRAPSKP